MTARVTPPEARPQVLLIDTATRRSIVAAGDGGGIRARSGLEAGHRHGSHVLEQVEAVLGGAGWRLDDVTACGVGTGPGSFTGLRVGLATAKTLAHVRSIPLLGVSSTAALAESARVAAGLELPVTVVLPAGAHDHYVAFPGEEPRLVPPGGLAAAVGDGPVVAVDLGRDVLGAEAADLGRAALDGLPEAVLRLVLARLDAGESDDAATLVPAYVALPRGIRAADGMTGWSPDLR